MAGQKKKQWTKCKITVAKANQRNNKFVKLNCHVEEAKGAQPCGFENWTKLG